MVCVGHGARKALEEMGMVRLVAAVMLLCGGVLGASIADGESARPAATARAPEKLTLAVVMISGTTPQEYVLVVNGRVGFKTVEALKNFVAGMPAGSSLKMDPGCLRAGDEPLLNSAKDMEAFKAFCADHKVELVIVPSG
jgi:hypothetical protein